MARLSLRPANAGKPYTRHSEEDHYWDRDVRNARARANHAAIPNAEYPGKLYCASCGNPITVEKLGLFGDHPYRILVCSKRRKLKDLPCHTFHMDPEELDARIEAAIRKEIALYKEINTIINDKNPDSIYSQAERVAMRNSENKKLDEKELAQSRYELFLRFRSCALSEENYARQRSQLLSISQDLSANRQQSTSEIVRFHIDCGLSNRWLQMMSRIPEDFTFSPAFAQSLIKWIIISPNHSIQVIWKHHNTRQKILEPLSHYGKNYLEGEVILSRTDFIKRYDALPPKFQGDAREAFISVGD